MPSAKYSILSTKPLSREQVQHAATQGIVVSEQAFIEVKPVQDDTVRMRCREIRRDGDITIVFTSPNAVKIVAEMLVENGDHTSDAEMPVENGDHISVAETPAENGDHISDAEMPTENGDHTSVAETPAEKGNRIYCIQGATRDAVETLLPQARIAGTAAHSKALAELMLKDSAVTSVVFFCGDIRRNELPDMLRSHHRKVEEIIVYKTLEMPVKLTVTYNGILFYSPSSVKSFFSANTLPPHTTCFAIGHTTGAALQAATENKVVISPEPAVDTLLQTVILYFDNINC